MPCPYCGCYQNFIQYWRPTLCSYGGMYDPPIAGPIWAFLASVLKVQTPAARERMQVVIRLRFPWPQAKTGTEQAELFKRNICRKSLWS